MTSLQNQINRDCIISSITAMLNVHYSDTLDLMKNLDNRILLGKTKLYDCSFQVCNGYNMYRKYLELIDPKWFEKRAELLEFYL